MCQINECEVLTFSLRSEAFYENYSRKAMAVRSTPTSARVKKVPLRLCIEVACRKTELDECLISIIATSKGRSLGDYRHLGGRLKLHIAPKLKYQADNGHYTLDRSFANRVRQIWCFMFKRWYWSCSRGIQIWRPSIQKIIWLYLS